MAASAALQQAVEALDISRRQRRPWLWLKRANRQSRLNSPPNTRAVLFVGWTVGSVRQCARMSGRRRVSGGWEIRITLCSTGKPPCCDTQGASYFLSKEGAFSEPPPRSDPARLRGFGSRRPPHEKAPGYHPRGLVFILEILGCGPDARCDPRRDAARSRRASDKPPCVTGAAFGGSIRIAEVRTFEGMHAVIRAGMVRARRAWVKPPCVTGAAFGEAFELQRCGRSKVARRGEGRRVVSRPRFFSARSKTGDNKNKDRTSCFGIRCWGQPSWHLPCWWFSPHKPRYLARTMTCKR